MSIGEIGGVVGNCEECRHTHGTSSCGTCGGGTGNIGPPALPPCRACLDGIAAASMSLEQLATIATDAGQSPYGLSAVASAAKSLQQIQAIKDAFAEAYHGATMAGRVVVMPDTLKIEQIGATPAITAGGDDDELILIDDDETAEAGKMFAQLAVEAVNAKASAEWEGDESEAATEVLDRADVIAALAPIEETWRKTWTECADLLKAVAEKDPAAAAGYVASCREWLTRAVQYGS